jgi:hypothetical protein
MANHNHPILARWRPVAPRQNPVAGGKLLGEVLRAKCLGPFCSRVGRTVDNYEVFAALRLRIGKYLLRELAGQRYGFHLRTVFGVAGFACRPAHKSVLPLNGPFLLLPASQFNHRRPGH